MMRQCDLGDTPYEVRIQGHAREIVLRIYRPSPASIEALERADSVRPENATASRRGWAATHGEAAAVPVILYFHGGGFTRGSLDDADATAAILARVPALVVSVDYSLAPAHPFPAAPEDAYCAARWIVEHAHEFGAHAHRIGVAGHDAGGNLATCLAAIARDRGGVRIAAQVLLAPLLDPSMTRVADDRKITSDVDVSDCAQCYRAYLPHASQRVHPYAAPLESRRLHGLPPALIASAEHDVLHVEAEKYASELINAGVPTQVTRFASTSHAALATHPAALAEAVAFFQRRLGAVPTGANKQID
jgi:acetyl esterase/lipase